jgi:long-chain acyl-CoA synthetase
MRQPVPASLERDWQEAVLPIRGWLGGWVGRSLRLATSGGATLPPAVAETLDAAGLTVLGAYGLTEHLCVAFNRPDRYAFDAVGTPMPGTEVRVAPDGELLVRRSALTFSGYHGLGAESAAAFTDGGEWLLTGDLAALDAQRVLRITGRKKELIALAGGKKVAPLAIEARLVEDPWIAHAMCYGEGRKFLSALICLRTTLVAEWARAQGIVCAPADLAAHPAVVARVQALVDRVNADVASPERIRRFHLLGRELSSREGELTETLKVRRPVVAERFRPQLEALYG